MFSNFKFHELNLHGAYIIEPLYADDERGAVIKDYNESAFCENGLKHGLKETFYTVSRKGVIRAVHFQVNKQQPKLVRCITGRVYDVIVDLRLESPTYKQWQGFILSGENRYELLVPEYFGHGYLVLEDSIVSYKCSEVFYSDYDSGIKWNDPDLGISWPIDEAGGEDELIISEKDQNLQSLQEYEKNMRLDHAGGQL